MKRSKVFDLICVGAKARKVAEIIQNNSPQVYMKKLIIDNSCPLKQQRTYKKNPFIKEHQVQQINSMAVKNIDPVSKKITMANMQQIHYKQLVYSGYDQEWKDSNYIDGLTDTLSTPYNSVLSDLKFYQSLTHSLNGHVIINIPKARHFGYSNFFMFDLLKKKKSQIKKGIIDEFKRREFKLTIINQGKWFFPYQNVSQKLAIILRQKENRLRELIKKQNIELIESEKVEAIDSKIKKAKISDQWRSFDSFYNFLPFENSDVINGVDILNVNQNTLSHEEFSDLFIIANNLPYIESDFGTFRKQQIIANNILNSQIGITRKSLYNGQTIFPTYNDQNNLELCAVNSQGAIKFDRLGSKIQKQSAVLQLFLKADRRTKFNIFNKVSSYLLDQNLSNSKVKL